MIDASSARMPGDGSIAAKQQRGSDARHPLARIDFDALLMCWACLTGLFPLYLKTLTGVFFVMMPVAFLLVRPERIVPLLRRASPVLAFAVFAMLSTLWSVLPGVTAYYSGQFMLTVLIACIIGVGLERRQMLLGAFAAFLFHGVVVFSRGMADGTLHHDSYIAFVGLAGSKNATADMACLGMLVAISTVGLAAFERRGLLATVAGALALADAYITYCALSAGSDAAVAVATMVLVAMLVSAMFAPAVRVTALTATLLTAVAAAATRKFWFAALFQDYLASSGKDDSFTGRTYLWSRADVLFHQHPLLGRGFGAFWREGDLESEAIWENMYIPNHQGFNFHSGYWELLVYLGYTGLILFGVLAILCIATLYIRTAVHITPAACLFCAFLIYDGMRFQFEALPLIFFSHNALFLYASFAAAFAARGSPECANYAPAHWRSRAIAPALSARRRLS